MSLLLGPDLLDTPDELEAIPVMDREPELPVQRAKRLYPHELKGWRLKAWRAFCPMNQASVTYGTPEESYRAIRTAYDTGVFESIETWAADRDPIAVGIVDGRYFLITRWGPAVPKPLVYLVGTLCRMGGRGKAAVRRLK